jgi:phage minor structural protein
MTPVLFDANETQFNSMGIGALADTISCLVHEARNGVFELTLEYPVDTPLFAELTEDRIIKAKANDNANMDPQLFRIYKSSKPLNGQCTFTAEHITGELDKNPIMHVSVTNGTAQQFGQAILSNTVYPHRFSFVSSDSTVATSDLSRVPAAQALVGLEGSLIDRWRGELTRDNFVIREEQNRGEDTGIIIEYGKNLTDASQEKAIDETYTSIYPYATVNDADGNSQAIELAEKIVESPYVGNYAYGRCLPIDLSGDDVTDETSLRIKAQAYVTQNDFGKPKVNLTINFIQLWQMEEYKNVAPLEHVNLCDWVTVRFKKIGIDSKVKVIDGVFDSLVEKWVSMELGDAKADWQSSVQSSISDVSATANQAAKISGYALTQANGKNKTYFSATEPTGNLVSGDLWYKVVNGQYTEMWRYNGISWNKILSADANDALNKAIDALTAANGKNTVYHQAAQPIAANNQDIWFRDNADGTVTIFVYQDGQWVNPIQDGVKAAQDQADTAVATADAASAQASNALTTAQGASSQASVANSVASAAQQTASDAYSQASSAWNKAQDAWNEALTKADADNVYTKEETDQALTGYASKTTVNTLTGRVDQAETSIDQNAQAITSKADTSTVNTLTGQVNTLSSTVSQQAGEIAARITSQDADSKYATQTALTATSSSLTSQISSVQTNLDGLQIGRRNLIKNSDFANGDTAWANVSAIVNSDYLGHNALYKAEGTGDTTQDFKCEQGKQYIVSFYANGKVSGFVVPMKTDDGTWTPTDDYRDNHFATEAFGTYTRVIIPVSVMPIGTVRARLIFRPENEYVNYHVTMVQIIEGNKTVDWSPALEDMATVVQFTSLSQTLSGFQTTVQQDYATKSLVTQTATSLQSSIDGKVGTDVYNSKVSQLANDINLRVSKNDVVNQINVSTEGILIDGSKTHITGQTTIDNAVIQSAMIAAVDAGKITTGYLSANRLAAKSVTVDKLDVVNLAAISANLGSVTSGTLNSVTVNSSTVNSGIINGTNIYASWFHVQDVPNSEGQYDTITIGDKTGTMDAAVYIQRQSTTAPSATAINSYGMTWKEFEDGSYLSPYANYGAYGEWYGYDVTHGNIKQKTHVSPGYIKLSYGDFDDAVVLEGYSATVYAVDLKASGQVHGDRFVFNADTTQDTYIGSSSDGALSIVANGAELIGVNTQGVTIPQLHVGGMVSDNPMVGTLQLNSIDSDTYIKWTGDGAFDLVSNSHWQVAIKDGATWVLNNFEVQGDGNAWANHWYTYSLEELKQDIFSMPDGQALSLVNSVDIRSFRFKADVNAGKDNITYGPIIGEGYNTPNEFLSADGRGTDDHSALYLAIKSIQELTALHQQDVLKIAELESRISLLEGAAA